MIRIAAMRKIIFCVSGFVFLFCFGVRLSAAAVRSAAGGAAMGEENYFALFMEGKKVGYAVNTREMADGKVKTGTTINVTINRGGASVSMQMSESTVETEKGKPLSFESEQQMSFMKMGLSGRVEPNGMLTITNSGTGGGQNRKIPWPAGALMPEGLRLLEKEKGLKKGTTYKVKAFESSSADVVDVNVSVGERQKVNLLGRVVELTEVRTKMMLPMAGEIENVGYVDDNLEIQKSIMPILGMTIEMVACPKEFAEAPPEVFDVIGKMFVKSPQPISDVRGAESITYYLSPAVDANVPAGSARADIIKLERIPSTKDQVVSRQEGGKVVVRVSQAVMPKGARIPYNGNDAEAVAALKPSRFVQSDNEKIVKLARQAVGNTDDAAEAARRIEKFVAGYIESKTLSVGYASAAEVAQSREGDCSEFAVLTAGLCRAAGIPAQVVVGIAYVSEWHDIKNSFGGHAWVQAYIGDRWVGLDSAFKSSGRGGFDAGHIALAIGSGDPEDVFRLVNTFGKFRIDKIEVAAKK